jgi:hypothetical protein
MVPIARPAAIVNPKLDKEIRDHIDDATKDGLWSITGCAAVKDRKGRALFVKYMAAKYGGEYSPLRRSRPPAGLYISNSPGFTWGNGCYVAPLGYAVSTAIYGRCGVVAAGDPSRWRIFNAADPKAAQLYVNWALGQPYARILMLTTHSQLANQYLRNRFKTQYHIDCVAFLPDEMNHRYTRHSTDRWLAVTDWVVNGGREIRNSGYSSRFEDARLAALVSEEFEPTRGGIGRRILIGPLKPPLPFPTLAADIAANYNASTIFTVSL